MHLDVAVADLTLAGGRDHAAAARRAGTPWPSRPAHRLLALLPPAADHHRASLRPGHRRSARPVAKPRPARWPELRRRPRPTWSSPTARPSSTGSTRRPRPRHPAARPARVDRRGHRRCRSSPTCAPATSPPAARAPRWSACSTPCGCAGGPRARGRAQPGRHRQRHGGRPDGEPRSPSTPAPRNCLLDAAARAAPASRCTTATGGSRWRARVDRDLLDAPARRALLPARPRSRPAASCSPPTTVDAAGRR